MYESSAEPPDAPRSRDGSGRLCRVTSRKSLRPPRCPRRPVCAADAAGPGLRRLRNHLRPTNGEAQTGHRKAARRVALTVEPGAEPGAEPRAEPQAEPAARDLRRTLSPTLRRFRAVGSAAPDGQHRSDEGHRERHVVMRDEHHDRDRLHLQVQAPLRTHDRRSAGARAEKQED